MSEEDIPPFESNEDLLSRCLASVKDACECAIYKTDGTLIQKINREKTI